MSSLRTVSSCLALLFLLADPAALAAKRPNVVFILTDNHGAWTLGCYGNRDIRTPNIDRLAAQGMLFNRAMSSNPVCSPTRGNLSDRTDSVAAWAPFLPRQQIHGGSRGLLHPERVRNSTQDSALGGLRLRFERVGVCT